MARFSIFGTSLQTLVSIIFTLQCRNKRYKSDSKQILYSSFCIIIKYSIGKMICTLISYNFSCSGTVGLKRGIFNFSKNTQLFKRGPFLFLLSNIRYYISQIHKNRVALSWRSFPFRILNNFLFLFLVPLVFPSFSRTEISRYSN